MRACFSRLLPFLLWAAVAGAPSQSLAGDSGTDRAKAHLKKAGQFYDVGRWDEAIAEYEKAYVLRPEPNILFDLAQAFRRKGDAKRALDVYENYLEKTPASPLRAEVEEILKTLKAQIERSQRPQGSEPPAALASPVVVPLPPIVAPAPGSLPGTVPVPAPVAPTPTAAAPTPALVESTPAPAGAPASPTPAASFVDPSPFAPPGVPLSAATPAAVSAPAPLAPPVADPVAPATDATLAAPSPSAPMVPLSSPPQAASAPGAVVSQPIPKQAPATGTTGSSGLPLRITGAVLILGGIVCLGLSAYNAYLTKQYSDKVTNTDTVFNPGHERTGKSAQTLQWVYGGIGAGAAVVGIALYWVGVWQKNSNKPGVTVVPAITPQGTMLAATGVF